MTGRRVLFALFPGCEILDVTGPVQAFGEANFFGAEYELLYVAATPTVRTAQGLELSSLAGLPEPDATDRVIVPGYAMRTTEVPVPVIRWIARAAAAGAEMCSVCVGTFPLGEAGLLDGRRCTTHWKRVDELQRRFPRATVLGDRLFVEDGRIVSSAGIVSGIDMSLALIERDGGPVLASNVAREMVVYMRRDGAHRQESVYLDYQTHLSPGVHRLQQHLIANPASRQSLAELAELAGTSERNVSRVFRKATGISIVEYRNRLRLERARDLLRNPTMTVEAVAAQCGFADARHLRRMWAREFGGAPRTAVAGR